MNKSRTNTSSHPFVNLIFVLAVGIAATGAVKHVLYRNEQIQTVRKIELTEKNISSIMQDEIPGVQAEISRQLVRYDIREKLRKNGSELREYPPGFPEVIRVKPQAGPEKFVSP